MTENDFNRKLVKELKKLYPPHVLVWKHCDMMTAGWPDISVSQDGRSTFCEVKLSDNRKIFEPLQYEILRKLHGWYLIWDVELRCGKLFRPDENPLSHLALSHIESYTFNKICERILRFF